ncbi:hypothetical protein PLANPX_5401 [Lacipirellula parvula]|uniref:Uncharacterized protein n=1 Tax=Lacipirellula parvula TaxID=2650471 RepID=A0A5K7XQC3_9BACT|nr:hypothetical protein PLANPX_5401 [Lacipirellula parvula]
MPSRSLFRQATENCSVAARYVAAAIAWLLLAQHLEKIYSPAGLKNFQPGRRPSK